MRSKMGAAFVALTLSFACATSPTGRKQLQLLPDSQMAALGAQSFEQVKHDMKPSHDALANAEVRCVADAITASLSPDYQKRAGVETGKWEVQVFETAEPNAFALPGGKIGVQSGMLKIAKTPAQLAAVLGHEVGHVIAQHGNERISQTLATESGLALLSMAAATNDPAKQQQRQLLLGLIGLGAQVGILLPFSRTQESEADRIGLENMARAGFDPHEAITLWKNMEAEGGGQPPEFLSTHPSHGTRIANLEQLLPSAMTLYSTALAQGKHPSCANPQPVASN